MMNNNRFMIITRLISFIIKRKYPSRDYNYDLFYQRINIDAAQIFKDQINDSFFNALSKLSFYFQVEDFKSKNVSQIY